MDVLIIIALIVAAVILFLVELFVIPGISLAGISALVCIIYANYYAFVNLGTGYSGFLLLVRCNKCDFRFLFHKPFPDDNLWF
jgi:membrane-bound ClpP family serine protease